jgi:hypothetical protein
MERIKRYVTSFKQPQTLQFSFIIQSIHGQHFQLRIDFLFLAQTRKRLPIDLPNICAKKTPQKWAAEGTSKAKQDRDS